MADLKGKLLVLEIEEDRLLLNIRRLKDQLSELRRKKTRLRRKIAKERTDE